MRIVFMGSSPFALAALKKLVEEKYNIVAVYTKSPKPKGRGHYLEKTPVHEYAEELGLSIETPRTLRTDEALAQLGAYHPDIAVVAAYGLILPQSVLSLPLYGCLNIHGSLLPRWRGAAPIERAIMAGDKITGITIMQMDDGVDTGDMLLKKELPINDNERFAELFDDMKILGASMIVEVLNNLNTLNPIKQADEGIMYAHKIGPTDYILNSEDTVEINYRKILALKACKYFYKDNNFFIIHETQRTNFISKDNELIIVDNNHLYMKCADGFLEVLKIQRPSKNIVLASEFIRGFRLTK